MHADVTTLPAHPVLTAMSAKGRQFLGCDLAFLGGGMTWVSERNLVTALGQAGAFGVLACGAMPPGRLDEEIRATKALSSAPFGVNLIVMHPDLAQLVEVCLANEVSHIVLAGGLPHKDTIDAIKRGGAKLVCFAPTLALAKKLVRSGADALVIEGSEAGGHVGPVSTSVLVQEILPFVPDVPVFVAGGIGHGEMIAAYLLLGAAGVQMGTRFAAATESIAHPAFKQALVRASARDAVTSVQIDPQFKVIPVRGLANAGTRRFVETQIDVIDRHKRGETTVEEASLQIERFWAGALRRAVIDGDVEQGSLMAGQSVGFVKAVEPIADILAELAAQTEAALARATRAGALPVTVE